MINYLRRIVLAFDMMVNAMLGGYAGETISFRAAVNRYEGKLWACWLCGLIERFVPRHCDLEQPSKEDQLSRGWVSARVWYVQHHLTPDGVSDHESDKALGSGT